MNFANIVSECQTNWISDEAPQLVGPHLHLNCFQKSSINCLQTSPQAGKDLKSIKS